jgi:hypothetical protein
MLKVHRLPFAFEAIRFNSASLYLDPILQVQLQSIRVVQSSPFLLMVSSLDIVLIQPLSALLATPLLLTLHVWLTRSGFFLLPVNLVILTIQIQPQSPNLSPPGDAEAGHVTPQAPFTLGFLGYCHSKLSWSNNSLFTSCCWCHYY